MSHIGRHASHFKNNAAIDTTIKPCYCRITTPSISPSRNFCNVIVKVRRSDNLVVDIVNYPENTPVRFYDKRYLYYAHVLGTIDMWSTRVGGYYNIPHDDVSTSSIPILYDN